MFNVSLKLRDAEGFVTPKGPSFSSARVIRSEVDGTEITFKAPSHQKFHGAWEKHDPEPYLGEEALRYRNDYDEEDAKLGREDHWRSADFFTRSWAFYGPWFSGKAASLHLSFQLMKIVNYPEDVSLFHPRALEQVIGDHLTFKFARFIDKYSGHMQELNAPVNWQPLNQLPVNAAKLDVVSQAHLRYRFRRYVYFPLAHDLMACLLFLPNRRYGSKTKAELDQLIDERPLLELTDNIINSLQLTLSPKAQAQQEAALKGLDDTSLTDNYPILKWDNLGEDEKLNIIADKHG